MCTKDNPKVFKCENNFIHVVYYASLSHKDKSHVRELYVKPNFM